MRRGGRGHARPDARRAAAGPGAPHGPALLGCATYCCLYLHSTFEQSCPAAARVPGTAAPTGHACTPSFVLIPHPCCSGAGGRAGLLGGGHLQLHLCGTGGGAHPGQLPPCSCPPFRAVCFGSCTPALMAPPSLHSVLSSCARAGAAGVPCISVRWYPPACLLSALPHRLPRAVQEPARQAAHEEHSGAGGSRLCKGEA